MSTVDDLRAEVRALAQLRHTFDKIDEKLKVEKLRQFEEIKQLLHLHEAAKQARDVTELSVREMAIDQWRMNADPVDGVEVVEGKSLEYNPVEALHFAVDHHLYKMVGLNKKTFEKVATQICDSGMVWECTVPKARIASDLSAYLPKETEDE